MLNNICLISNGFCTMGFALPASIGAKMVFPKKKVLSINGDAGFLMNVQDLETREFNCNYLTRSVDLDCLTKSGAVYRNEGISDLVTSDTTSSEILHKPNVPSLEPETTN